MYFVIRVKNPVDLGFKKSFFCCATVFLKLFQRMRGVGVREHGENICKTCLSYRNPLQYNLLYLLPLPIMPLQAQHPIDSQ